MNTHLIKQYCYLARLHKPIGIFLLLWPTLWALWLASEGHPNAWIVSVFVMGVIVMRSAGCVINDIADRHFDGRVARTCFRPLITGEVTLKGALIFFGILLFIAFVLVLCLNQFTILLACAGACFAIIYPFMKRFTYWPQAGLGIAFSWGVPMAFAALNNGMHARDWLLFLAAVIWPLIYDTFYAMVDRVDDIKIGIKSTAILFGSRFMIWIGLLQGLFIVLLGYTGYLFHLHVMYYVCLAMASLLFIYQQRLICHYESNLCFKAFLNNHWVGCIIFMGIMWSI